jgi:hypothetical protein
MKINQRRAIFTIGAGTGGLLAAAFLPMAVAVADEFDFTPNIATFIPEQVEGYPPLIDKLTGTENWTLFDVTTNVPLITAFGGTDTETTIGSFTNDLYLTSSDYSFSGTSVTFFAPIGTQLDLANFGSGFENAWMDIPSGADAGTSDLFITPFGDFALFGTGFADLAAALTP